MRIKMKYKLSPAEADRLIERYYEGLTTGEEEKQLQTFLSQAGLPERYKPEQAIFGYFNHKKQKAVFKIAPYIRWASVAAVVVLVLFSVQVFLTEKKANFAYIDGNRITNVQKIKSQALASLSDVSSSRDEVEEGLKNINDNGLIEQQLDVFSGLEK
ncbi:MAG: hypothetical protein Q8904_09615 [Bacteroidota bacterium]|nr:hypothetical protein [Bacteroidota bacterium]